MAKDRKIDMVILGLLIHEDLTGYDIKKNIDGAIRFFWKGSFGSIYPALAAMEEQGLVQKIPSASGGREKILYHITDAGKSVVRDWLSERQASNELKYETLLKLFFGGAADPETAMKNIEVFEEQIRSELALLKVYQGNLEKVLDQKDHVYFYLTVTFGVDTMETYLKWCTKAKRILKSA